MDMIFYGLLLLFLIPLWMAICNNKTFNQRMHARNKIFGLNPMDNTWLVMFSHYQNVTYEKHFWYLFTFRNPKKLYNKEFQDFMGWNE